MEMIYHVNTRSQNDNTCKMKIIMRIKLYKIVINNISSSIQESSVCSGVVSFAEAGYDRLL